MGGSGRVRKEGGVRAVQGQVALELPTHISGTRNIHKWNVVQKSLRALLLSNRRKTAKQLPSNCQTATEYICFVSGI